MVKKMNNHSERPITLIKLQQSHSDTEAICATYAQKGYMMFLILAPDVKVANYLKL